MCKEVIWNDCNPPTVNISDQDKGLIASLPLMLPGCQLQLCNWHAVQNIRARVNKSKRGYPQERRENVSDAAWEWVQSPDFASLQENRDRLLELLYGSDQEYFWEYWFPKESNVVTCYTRNYRNLGCSSTQSNESMHPILKAVLNPQSTLENAVKAMQAELRLWYKHIRDATARSRIDRPRAVDWTVFQVVIGRITLFAIEKVNPEWIATKQLVEESNRPDYELTAGPCNCEILVRYLLPCRHLLFRACAEGFPIPLSLFHPRWWIDDVPTPREFTPRYYDETLDPHDQDPLVFQSKGKNRFLEAAAQLEELHTKLPRQQADQLANQLATFQVNVASSHAAIQKNLQGIPTELPAPPPTKRAGWTALQEKKKHDKANARKLTSEEASERDARQQDKRLNQVLLPPVFRAPPPLPPQQSASAVFRAPPPQQASPVFQAPLPSLQQSLLQPKKPRGRPKGSKNSTASSTSSAPSSSAPPFSAPPSSAPPTSAPPSSAPPTSALSSSTLPSTSTLPMLPTSSSGRQIKAKKVWEQAKGLSQTRPRGPTLEAAVDNVQPTKKKSKQIMVPTEDIDERESQQQRILGAAYLQEHPRTEE